MASHETPFHQDEMDYKISVDKEGVHHATNKETSVTVIPETGSTAKLHNLRAIKGVGGDDVTFDSCLVAELDGVKVYLKGNTVVVTRRELRL